MRHLLVAFGLFGLAVSLARSADLLDKASSSAPAHSNPYDADERALRAGQKIFRRECSGCHGEDGRGNGRRNTPALATPLVREANPGALFWILRNGSPSHRMPSFSHLPAQQRWQIIAYLQHL